MCHFKTSKKKQIQNLFVGVTGENKLGEKEKILKSETRGNWEIPFQ
jgi:hypothetical protein